MTETMLRLCRSSEMWVASGGSVDSYMNRIGELVAHHRAQSEPQQQGNEKAHPLSEQRVGVRNVYCTMLMAEQLLLSKLASPSSKSLTLTKYCPGASPLGSRKEIRLLSDEALTTLTAEDVAAAEP